MHSAKGVRLPDDVQTLPGEWLEWARAEKPGLDVEAVAASFIDYWHSATGRDAAKRDWQATWRNWVRREKVPAGRLLGVGKWTSTHSAAVVNDPYATEPAPPFFTPEQDARFGAMRDPLNLSGKDYTQYQLWLREQAQKTSNEPPTRRTP